MKRLSEVEKQSKVMPGTVVTEKTVKGEQPLNTGEVSVKKIEKNLCKNFIKHSQ